MRGTIGGAVDLLVQPSPGVGPPAIGGGRGDAQRARGLIDRAAGEKAQLDQLRLRLVLLREFNQRLVDGQQSVVVPTRGEVDVFERLALPVAAAFDAAFAPRVLDEDAPHGLGRRGEKVSAVVPFGGRLGADQTHVRLVNQRRRLERLSRCLRGHARGGEIPQLVVHEREQLGGGLAVAGRSGVEESRYVRHSTEYNCRGMAHNSKAVGRNRSSPQSRAEERDWPGGYGEVEIIRIGARKPIAVVPRDKKADNAWTTVAPKGAAVAWKDKGFTVVRALPGGEPIARVKSGFGYDLRFSPGGQWLTEVGEQVFRVFDRSNSYEVIARIPAPSFILADVSGETAVVTSGKGNTVAVWDLASKAATASLNVGDSVSALALSADGRRLLTGNMKGELVLWDAGGAQLRQYDWKIDMPIDAA